jgi:hypothetical protein
MARVLNDSTNLVVAWAEVSNGPGWHNTIIWYMTYNQFTGKYKLECLQLDEQTDFMQGMHKIASTVTEELTNRVQSLISKKYKDEE